MALPHADATLLTLWAGAFSLAVRCQLDRHSTLRTLWAGAYVLLDVGYLPDLGATL